MWRCLLSGLLSLCAISMVQGQTIVGSDRERPELSRNVLGRLGPSGLEVRSPYGPFQKIDPRAMLVPLVPAPAPSVDVLSVPSQQRERAQKP